MAQDTSDDVWNDVEHKYADSHGVKIHYAALGPEDSAHAPLVVMIHGFPDFWYSWRKQMRALADNVGTANQIRIDLDIDEAERAGETAKVALYTIIRELLDQAIRRGPPTRIEVKIQRLPDGGVQTRVADDAEPERRRRSFEAIEERVGQLHGEIAVHAGEAGGTEVRVTLPPYAARR